VLECNRIPSRNRKLEMRKAEKVEKLPTEMVFMLRLKE
jgi:hypothetical protein